MSSCSLDKTIKLWNLTNGRLIRTLANHTNQLFFSVDLFSEDVIMSGSMDTDIKFWQVSTGQLIDTISNNLKIIVAVVLANTSVVELDVNFADSKCKLLMCKQ